MSLTSFLKDDPELRVILDNTFEKPDIELDAELRAEPQTSNYALVGTAFDYLLRFYVEEMYDSVSSSGWVAENGVLLTMGEDEEFENAQVALENAQKHHSSFLESGVVTDELLSATLDLGRLDWVYRSGRLPDGLGEHDPGDITDLRQLYQIIPDGLFGGAESVLLNPTFGEASQLVAGADADIVVDHTLIDIKTTKHPKLKIDYWRQLVGYCVLADIADSSQTGIPELTNAGIYFSRHGELWTTPTEQIYQHEKYDQFKDWFCNQAQTHFQE